MAKTKIDVRRIVRKRAFYPSALSPTEAEKGELKRRRRDWFPHHKEIWDKTQDYAQAVKYLGRPSYMKESLIYAGAFVLAGVASWFLWPDVISHALRSGFTKANGDVIEGVNSGAIMGLFVQGGLGIFGFFALVEKKKRNQASLTKERYEEWLAKPTVVQDDLQKVLLPTYEGPNPYDPTDPNINLVLGEYFPNDAHKFGPVAHWYTMKMKGLQAGGCIIFGITGSGKTSSMLKPLMRQGLSWMAHVSFDPDNKGREKLAGFILDPKGSLAGDARSVLNTAGIDPIRDPLQLTKDGPANITALYYLMHEKNGERNLKGEPLLNPEFIEGYRGRSDDYLELGYDELKVDKVWAKFEEFQAGAGHLVGQEFEAPSVDSKTSLPKILKGGQVTMTVPNEAKKDESKEDFVAPYDLKSFLVGKGNIPRRDLANMHVVVEPIVWEKGLDPAVSGPLEPLGKEMDDLLRWIWVGRKLPSLEGNSQTRTLDVHPMTPGLPFSTKFALDSYAVSRNLIRRYAPTKQRPTAGVDEYRDFWGWREVRLWEFRDHQVQVANRAEAGAQMFALVRRFPAPRISRQDLERSEAYGTQLAKTLKLLRTPLNDLLGDSAVAWEYGRPKATASPELVAAVESIRVSLDSKMSSAFRDGNFQALTVPLSERPKPEPVDKKTRDKLKGRYAAPDPMVNLAQEVAGLRQKEQELVDSLLSEGREGILRAEAEVTRVVATWGEHLDEKIRAIGKKPVAPSVQFLEGAMKAVQAGHGTAKDLASDLMATILGMPTVASEETTTLLNGFLLRAPGGKGGAFGLQAAHGALNPLSKELWRFVHRASDAVAEEWCRRSLSGVMAAAQNFLGASGLMEEERDRLIGEVRTAVKNMVDGWIHAHLEAMEGVLETHAWRSRLEDLGGLGVGIFKEADRLSRMGAMVGFVEDSLVTDPRDRIPAHPNVDWGSLIWSWGTTASGARKAPFWRGPMSGLDMTPLHACQWDPAWSAITWRLLGYCLNAAPSGVEQLEHLARRGTVLGVYHQAALDSFVTTVAPNIAWRTDGVYAYNPLFAPDLAPIVVAGTFNQTVFAATSEGKDSGDPFWENASFTVVFNILQTLQLVDGYASFPKIDALVTQEAVLRDYVGILRERAAKRDGTPEEIEVINNILRWVDGEWLTEASSKSETKDNIVRSLSVVTQPFKEPKFAICFAPACKEDISFPSWTWVMKEGKVVCANLPWEKYEKVAKVVLPLANKTFQKGVQMRDGQRGINDQIAHEKKGNRVEIGEIWKQADELSASIARRAAERLALMIFFQREMALNGRRRFQAGDHLLVQWRHAANEKKGILRPTPCLGDVFMRHARLGSVSLDAVGGFVLGALGKAVPMEGAYLLVPRAVQAGIEAGFFVQMLLGDAEENKVSLEEMAKRGDGPATKLLEAFGSLATVRMEEEVRLNLELLGFQGPEDVAKACNALSGILLTGLDTLLGRPAVMKWTSRMEQLIHDERGGAKDSADQGAGASLRPRFKLRALYRKIRQLEAQIAEMPNTERPILYLVDECHFFIQGKEDAQYVSVARSNNALNFYSTQSPNALMAKMDENVAKQFLDNLPNRIILRMPDSKAAEACAEYLGGKIRKSVVEKNISQSFGDVRADSVKGGGQGKSEGGSVSVTIKEEERWIVDTHNLVNLQAFECYAMVWDGKRNQPPRRVYSKPDYLYVVPTIRNYKRVKGDRYGDLPKEYKDGTDLFELPVPRLLELGVIDASR